LNAGDVSYLKSFIHFLVAASINFVFAAKGKLQATSVSKIHIASSPLFRDPVTGEQRILL
jgi:hypothetical protein